MTLGYLSRAAIGLSLTLGATAQATPESVAHDLLTDLVVPIHTYADHPYGPYGTWAAGSNYKASFHDGFTFYPFVGERSEHRPLRWRTVSMRVGRTELPLGRPTESFTAHRFERRWANDVVEAYDVRAEGVEQTFVLRTRPRAGGDLVITGEVSTALEAEPVEGRHAELTFRDGGFELVSYGAATAVDANGRKTPMTTRFDGEHIELRLAKEALAAAAFPLVVDPLIYPASALDITVGAPKPIIDIDASANRSRLTIGVCRLTALGDADVIAFRVDAHDLTTRDPLFAFELDLSSAVAVAVGTRTDTSGPVAAWQRNSAIGPRVVYQTQGASIRAVGGPAGQDQTDPDVGGTDDFTTSIFDEVFVLTYATRAAGGVVRALIDYGSNSPPLSDTVVWTGAPGVADEPRPAVVHDRFSGFDGWWMVWRDGPSSLALGRITDTGAVTTFPASITASNASLSQPKIDGDEHELLVTYTHLANGFGIPRFKANRVHVDVTHTPSTDPTFELGAVLAPNTVRNAGVAFDRDSHAHWVVAIGTIPPLGHGPSTYDLMRLGYHGGVVESDTITGIDPAPTWGRGESWIPFGTSGSIGGGQLDPLWCLRFTQPASNVSEYGTSCAPDGTAVYSGTPYAGSGPFEITASVPGFQFTSAWYMVGFRPFQAPLDVIGMPGCELLVQPVFTKVGAIPYGWATFTLNLGDLPVYRGDFYGQLIYLDPTANAMGLVTHSAQRYEVR